MAIKKLSTGARLVLLEAKCLLLEIELEEVKKQHKSLAKASARSISNSAVYGKKINIKAGSEG